MSRYRHEFVGRLDTFANQMLSQAKNIPLFGSLLIGFSSQIPMLLAGLDQDTEMVNKLRNMIAEVLGVEIAPLTVAHEGIEESMVPYELQEAAEQMAEDMAENDVVEDGDLTEDSNAENQA